MFLADTKQVNVAPGGQNRSHSREMAICVVGLVQLRRWPFVLWARFLQEMAMYIVRSDLAITTMVANMPAQGWTSDSGPALLWLNAGRKQSLCGTCFRKS